MLVYQRVFQNGRLFQVADYLVGGLEPWNFMTFHSVGNGIIIPTDELYHFSEG